VSFAQANRCRDELVENPSLKLTLKWLLSPQLDGSTLAFTGVALRADAWASGTKAPRTNAKLTPKPVNFVVSFIANPFFS
jgi:hypothetical protein